MRILLIGGTGETGLQVIRQALQRRLDVTAVLRSPQKLGALADAVTLFPGNVFDPKVIGAAAAGCTAVLSTLGSRAGLLGRGATTVYSQAATALATAMPRAGVRRLVFCTSAGVEPHDPGEVLPYRLIAKPLFLQRAYDDMTLAERVITNSDLDWTLVRPSRLTNRPGGAGYRVSPRFRAAGGTAIARTDVAAFMLDQVTDNSWTGKTPTLTT
jgi:putative NADH-flavin reductase